MDKQTEKTALKIALGFLVVLILGIGAFLATALTANNNHKSFEEDDSEDESQDVPITGSVLEQASAAALNYVGQGRVTDTEAGDEEGYYEVEITLENGNQTDVHLDESFNVLSVESDGEDGSEEDEEEIGRAHV